MNKTARLDTSGPIRIDPKTLWQDPHARLAELRQHYACVEIAPNEYLVLRAQDVLCLLSDPRTRQIEGVEYASLNRIPDGIVKRFQSEFILFSNGEAHRTRRGFFDRGIAQRVMQDVQAQGRAIADSIVATLPRRANFDFVEHMAARLPASMIAAILGLPQADSRYFAHCVQDLGLGMTPIYPHQHHERIENSTGELFDYVEEELRARRTAPRDDLLSTLLANWKDDPAISFESLVYQVLGLVVAGSDTVRTGFAMIVANLLQRRHEWDALCGDAGLISGAVAEGMRYEPSVGSVARVTLSPIELGEVHLPAGAVLRLGTMSAMRDPALYARPNCFDIRRADHPKLHLVFGLGPHRCFGGMLAQAEMEQGLAALLAAAPGIEMETKPQMLGFGGIRQISPMEVRIP